MPFPHVIHFIQSFSPSKSFNQTHQISPIAISSWRNFTEKFFKLKIQKSSFLSQQFSQTILHFFVALRFQQKSIFISSFLLISSSFLRPINQFHTSIHHWNPKSNTKSLEDFMMQSLELETKPMKFEIRQIKSCSMTWTWDLKSRTRNLILSLITLRIKLS